MRLEVCFLLYDQPAKPDFFQSTDYNACMIRDSVISAAYLVGNVITNSKLRVVVDDAFLSCMFRILHVEYTVRAIRF